MDISKVVNEGLYKTFIDFNKDNNNLKKLIDYCEHLEPQQQSFVRASSLIKFYRLPIIIAFRKLYQKYKGVTPQTISPQTKTILEDIAAWVNSLLQKLQIELFQQIRFIFQWGRAKKKYNIQVSPHEIQFAKYIAQLSKKRQKIKQKLQKNGDVQQDLKELQNFTTSEQLLFFEESFVDYIKKKVVIEANSKIFESRNKEKVKQLNQTASKAEKVVIENRQSPKKQQQSSSKANEHKNLESTTKKMEQKFSQQKQHYYGYDELPYEQERKLPMCCRSYFMQDEVIQQAENQMIEYKHYKYPFVDNPAQKVTKIEKIKKTLCGFLNNKGGTIYFGIKEHEETKKRQIYGYNFTERYKSQFETDIFDLLKDILPEVQINCTIKWAPIKNRNKNQFIPGRYISKVIIERGAKDQVYSYIHDRVEKFVFKTQNQFLVIKDPQKILKFFRNKIQNPQTPIYRLHNHPCREPLRGKPIYKQSQSEVSFSGHISSPSFDFEEEANYSRQICTEKKSFVEKQSIRYLIRGYSKQSLEKEMDKRKIKYRLLKQIQLKDLIIEIYSRDQIENLKFEGFQIYQIYTWVRCEVKQKDEASIFSDVAAQMEKEYKCTINKKVKYIVDCQTEQISTRFWIKVTEMGLNAHFIPASNMDK